MTTDDIMRILNIESEFIDEHSPIEISNMSYTEYCEEILKIYNDEKN